MRLRRVELRYEQLVPSEPPAWSGAAWTLSQPAVLARPEWRPPTDVYELAGEWVVKLELAGLSEEDFEILLYQDVLVVQGERRWRLGPEAVRLHAAEIRHGPFLQAVRIPGPIARDRITAKYETGVLLVRLPKAGGGM
jgi:HSP20 family protein